MKLRSYLLQAFEENPDNANGAQNDTGTNKEGQQQQQQQEPQQQEKKYTDEDIDKIINRKFAEWQKKQQKAVDEATRLANMTAQEKAEHQRDEWEKKYNELLQQNTLSQMNVEARKILTSEHVSCPDAIVSLLVAEDADKTKENVDAFVKMFKEAVQAEVQNLNKKPAPKAGTQTTWTKEKILAVKDVKERQRLIRENYNLFKK